MRRAVLSAMLAVGFACSGLSVVIDAQGAPASVVRIPFPRYDGTLTPYTFRLGYPLVTLIYDTLLWRDAQGLPRLWLARSVQRSNGGRRVTVHLRDGVRWHDGQAVTANDVAFTFRLVGERSPGTPELADVERVRVVDRNTVVFDLRRPSLGFDQQPLADLPILPRHLWDALPPGQAAPRGLAVGSGPYRLVRATRATGYELRANQDYFKGRPQVQRIDVPIIHDAQRNYAALRERRVDMLPFTLPENAADDLVGRSLGIALRTGPLYSGTALLLNLRRSPFDRIDARQAVAQALDLERIVRNVAPAVTADHGYIHPASPWASPRTLHAFEPREAQAAVRRLRLPPIRVLAPDNDPIRLEAGRQVMLALVRAGAQATLIKRSHAGLSQAIGERGAKADFDAAVVSTPALASYDPDFLAAQFGSEPRAAPLNHAGYHSPAFDALARRVAAAPDEEARRQAVQAELQLLARDAPAVPLFFSQGAFAIRPAIYDGWVFVKGSGLLDKRSFLAGPAANDTDEGADAVGQHGGSDSSAADVLEIISLIVLIGGAAAAIVGVLALLRRRSGDRR